MENEKVKIQVEYWLKTSEHDYDTMLYLFRDKRYSDCLFFGHIILEKILKAFVVLKTKESAPITHDLISLINLSGLSISESEKNLLKNVNKFNIRVRYPDYLLQFYQTCDREYVDGYLDEIQILWKKFVLKLKSLRF